MGNEKGREEEKDELHKRWTEQHQPHKHWTATRMAITRIQENKKEKKKSLGLTRTKRTKITLWVAHSLSLRCLTHTIQSKKKRMRYTQWVRWRRESVNCPWGPRPWLSSLPDPARVQPEMLFFFFNRGLGGLQLGDLALISLFLDLQRRFTKEFAHMGSNTATTKEKEKFNKAKQNKRKKNKKWLTRHNSTT